MVKGVSHKKRKSVQRGKPSTGQQPTEKQAAKGRAAFLQRTLIHWIGYALIAALAFFLGGKWGQGRIAGPPTLSPLNDASAPGAAPSSSASETPRLLPLSGEFEKQAAIILGAGSRSGEGAIRYTDIYRKIIDALWRNTQLICLFSNDLERRVLQNILNELDAPKGAVMLCALPVDSVWVRDYGPIFLRRQDGSVVIIDLRQPNQRKIPRRPGDDAVPEAFGKMFDIPVASTPLWMAGGNLLSNGDGLYVTTAQAAIATRAWTDQTSAILDEDIRQTRTAFVRHLGARRWLSIPWLHNEPTGHIDGFLTFAAPDVAVVGQCDSALEPKNAAILDMGADALAKERTTDGRPIQVYRVPMLRRKSDGAWYSYTNVVYANGVLLVPSFKGVNPVVENEVMALYQRLLPERKIIPIRMDAMVSQQGYLHCLTRNVPAFAPLPHLGPS